MLDRNRIYELMERLQVLPYFPMGNVAVMEALCDLVESMVTDMKQVEWLVKRMTGGLYAEWPGPAEVRAVFTSKFRSKDGINGYSSVYPDGIPSERPAALQIAGPKLAALPPGHTETADAKFEQAVHVVAETTAMPAARPDRNNRVHKLLEEILTPPEARPKVEPTPQIITQEDISRAVEELHRKQAAE